MHIINSSSVTTRLTFSGRRKLNNEQLTLQPDLFAPWAPDTHGLNRFAVIGDPGSGTSHQHAVAKQMVKTHEAKPFASVLVLGDNVYENGEPHLFEERIFDPYKQLMYQQVRFFPILGNHDVRAGHADKQLTYWGAPSYYQFSQGPVDFFALDTTVMLPGFEGCYDNNPALGKKIADQQLLWLDAALGQSKAKFKVVYGHYPLYSSGKSGGRDDITKRLRDQLEPLLIKHGVSLYLAGHEHHYERSQLIKGVQHIISGAAGKLRKIFYPTANYPREVGLQKYHFMLFTVLKDRLQFEVISRKGKVLDSGEIAAPQKLDATA